MNKVKKVFDLIEKILSVIISVIMAAITLAITYQVILRYVFHHSNVWAEEFARYGFVWVVMLGSAIASRKLQHLQIDVFIKMFSATLRKVVQLISYIIMEIFLAFLFLYGIEIIQQSGGQLSTGLQIPMPFMYSSVPVGAGLMFLFTLEVLMNQYIAPFFHKKNEHASL